MYINFLIIILLINIYRINPIRYSNRCIGYKLTYNKLMLYILYVTIIVELLQIHLYYLSSISTYLILIPAFIFYIIIDILDDEPVIDDGSFIPPPKHLSTSIFNYLIIVLLIYNIIKSKNKYIASINIIIIIVLFYQRNNYAACKYDLPITWSKF